MLQLIDPIMLEVVNEKMHPLQNRQKLEYG